MSPAPIAKGASVVNGYDKGHCSEATEVIVVGAGPTGLMLAYVNTITTSEHPLNPRCPDVIWRASV